MASSAWQRYTATLDADEPTLTPHSPPPPRPFAFGGGAAAATPGARARRASATKPARGRGGGSGGSTRAAGPPPPQPAWPPAATQAPPRASPWLARPDSADADAAGAATTAAPRALEVEMGDAPEASQDASGVAVGADAVELLRRRGNAAYARGAYARAGEHYTRAAGLLKGAGGGGGGGAGVVGGHNSLGKLLSNLAAVHLQLGRPRAALAQCEAALAAEPGYARAATRAATAHLRLGEWEAAGAALDTAAAALAACGAAADTGTTPADVAAKRAELASVRGLAEGALAAAASASTASAGEAALGRLEGALGPAAAPHCLAAAAARARLLLALGRGPDAQAAVDALAVAEGGATPPLRAWVHAQAAFVAGDLAAAAAGLDVVAAGAGGALLPPALALPGLAPPPPGAARAIAARLRALADLKARGNAAIQAGKYADAEEAYTAALEGGGGGGGGEGSSTSDGADASTTAPSAAFAAVLHANRAAARQAQGVLAGALADCLTARALAPGYAKAAARAAALLEAAGLAECAVKELEAAAAAAGRDATAAAARLPAARAAARAKPTVDHYKLLGLNRPVTDGAVKVAYKKAALAFHPDKVAGRSRFAAGLPCGGVEALGADPARDRVRAAAEYLFKAIGAARTALADPAGRAAVDAGLAAYARRARGGGGAYGTAYAAPAAGWARGGPAGSSGRASGYGWGYGGGSGGYGGYGNHDAYDSDEEGDDYFGRYGGWR